MGRELHLIRVKSSSGRLVSVEVEKFSEARRGGAIEFHGWLQGSGVDGEAWSGALEAGSSEGLYSYVWTV